MNARIWITSALWGALCAYASLAVAQTAAAPRVDAAHRLVGSDGMTLYTYDRDSPGGPSRCEGICARLWPPALAAADATLPEGYGVIVRADGSRQWTWRGRPLYRYTGDTKAGSMLGDGVNGTWHVARHP
ncbi:MAG: hypothetical protein KGN77_14105 [Xanthomonadaceae bacterium]|nr:hypothetical protein [Xanthomonadaceae bacterium]MDE1964743.1 hypothetical protein [Xanthomonadaceae bacterium]